MIPEIFKNSFNMQLTSFIYLLFLIIALIIYYLSPKKAQWAVLIYISFLFYWMSAVQYTIVYIILSTIVTYYTSLLIGKYNGNNKKNRNRKILAFFGIIFNISIWFILKGWAFWWRPVSFININFFGGKEIYKWTHATAIGMGYYTAKIISYIMDCYYETIKPETNILKLFSYIIFFPELTVGPISRYNDLGTIFEKHNFKYENLCFGAQRILWGFFKKLVVADRLGIILSGIWGDYSQFAGLYPLIAMLLYPIQMYCDFSGCVDIVIGTSELFDIKIVENFNNPFFARNTQEFWQKWHITLGTFARDYVYYPVLKSSFFDSIRNKLQNLIRNKKIVKKLVWAIATGILWFIMGFWHGAFRYIIGVSFWYFLVTVIGEFCLPFTKRLKQILKIDENSFSFHLFQSIRTYIIYAFGALFFSVGKLSKGIEYLKRVIKGFDETKPWILFDDRILKLKITWWDVNLIIIGVILLLIVGILREKYGYARIWMQKQMLVFRWLVWIGLFLAILVYGIYGPAYNASDFIYRGF